MAWSRQLQRAGEREEQAREGGEEMGVGQGEVTVGQVEGEEGVKA